MAAKLRATAPPWLARSAQVRRQTLSPVDWNALWLVSCSALLGGGLQRISRDRAIALNSCRYSSNWLSPTIPASSSRSHLRRAGRQARHGTSTARGVDARWAPGVRDQRLAARTRYRRSATAGPALLSQAPSGTELHPGSESMLLRSACAPASATCPVFRMHL